MPARPIIGAAGALLVLAAMLTPAATAETLAGLRRAEPQPEAAQLTPGLAVQYAYAIVNHLDEFKGKKFEAGTPLTHLDYKMGGGNILTSKSADGVLAIITGLVRFEKAGVYGFDVTSNDGVRLEIGGKKLYEDPTVHADDTSDRIDVKIDQPGWYPITVTYFEKRNTASLVLRWIGPGETGKLAPVPAKAFAHIK
jgi:hypothetical protein